MVSVVIPLTSAKGYPFAFIADSRCHGHADVAVDVDYAHCAFGALAQHVLGDADCVCSPRLEYQI